MKARDGLRMVLGEARARGAEEGRLDAAERARHAPVRRTRVERGEPVKAGDWWLVAFRERERHTLGTAVRWYCVRVGDRAVRVHQLAAATLDVVLAQLERYQDLPRDMAALDVASGGRAKPEEPAPASPPQRVLVVHTEGDDWMGARKGLAAWQADKTPGAGFTTGGSAAPLAMLHTPAADSADVAKLLARYEKAGRRVLDLGVVAGDKVFDCDPSNRAIRERWNVAHPHARVSVPEALKARKTRGKGK